MTVIAILREMSHMTVALTSVAYTWCDFYGDGHHWYSRPIRWLYVHRNGQTLNFGRPTESARKRKCLPMGWQGAVRRFYKYFFFSWSFCLFALFGYRPMHKVAVNRIFENRWTGRDRFVNSVACLRRGFGYKWFGNWWMMTRVGNSVTVIIFVQWKFLK